MFEFKLPDLGEGIHEGEILKWHVEPGATIKEDDPLVDVDTDKAAVTIPPAAAAPSHPSPPEGWVGLTRDQFEFALRPPPPCCTPWRRCRRRSGA